MTDKESPNTSTAKSSRRDSLNERVIMPPTVLSPEPTLTPTSSAGNRSLHSGSLQSPIESHKQPQQHQQQQPQLQQHDIAE